MVAAGPRRGPRGRAPPPRGGGGVPGSRPAPPAGRGSGARRPPPGGGGGGGGDANPPYLTDEEYAAIDPSVRLFEPREALVSGPDGLDATRALLAGAQGVLEPGGLLALEIDERRADAVQTLALASGWAHVTVHEDLFGRPRYALARASPVPTFRP